MFKWDNKALVVTLTPEEIAMAAAVAVHRGIDAIVKERENNHGFKGNGWTENIEGFCAELVVSKALDVFYSAGAGKDFKGADVAENIQVRYTQDSNNRLIVRPADNPSDFYVLVTGLAPTFTIQGFTTGEFARQDAFLDNPGNGRPDAWWVPKNHLTEINLLPLTRRRTL